MEYRPLGEELGGGEGVTRDDGDDVSDAACVVTWCVMVAIGVAFWVGAVLFLRWLS